MYIYNFVNENINNNYSTKLLTFGIGHIRIPIGLNVNVF